MKSKIDIIEEQESSNHEENKNNLNKIKESVIIDKFSHDNQPINGRKTNCQPNLNVNNPIDISYITQKAIEKNGLDFEYIIAIGKYDYKNVKQLDKLIDSYSKSILPKEKIKLVLLGVGKNNSRLKKVAIQSRVEDEVLFLDFDENPFKYLARANFLVLSSKYEGFPMSIVECLACQTPVISFNCVSGPKEIITDKENGLLVENQNFEKLTLAMNEFVSNQMLHDHCKKNSLESVSKFSIEKIGKEWLDLMKFDII